MFVKWTFPVLNTFALALLLFASQTDALGQTTPVVHCINDLNQDAYTMLSNGSNFITSFKATNDVQVALISGSVGSLFVEAFAGLGPNNNNPAFITNFIGLNANGTGDGSVVGRIECFQSSSSSMALQFDFAVPLTSSDRILIADVDLSEKYGVQAYFAGQPLDLSGWSYAGYSGGESPTAGCHLAGVVGKYDRRHADREFERLGRTPLRADTEPIR